MNSSVIPASIMRMLGSEYKQDNREVIISYLTSERGSVVLTEKQQDLMNRWSMADDLMRTRRYTSNEVAQLLAKKFDYTIATAWRDINDARHVYGNTIDINKNYLLALHVDRIEAAMVLAEKQGKKDALAKLFDAYTKALAQLPDTNKEVPAPAAIVFNISMGQGAAILPDDITPASAAQTAADKLAAKGVYVDFEEVLKQV